MGADRFFHAQTQARMRSHLPGAARVVHRASDPDSVVLTFDDGPHASGTPAVLECLAQSDVHATFFVVVEEAVQHPGWVTRVSEAGHEIGLHSDVHERLDRISASRLTERLGTAKDRLEQILGGPVRLHRPPFGRVSYWNLIAARRVGMDVVLWSASPRDWEPQSDEELARRMDLCLRPGALVLLHDGSGSFTDPAKVNRVLPAAIRSARARGLSFAMLP